MYSVDLNKISLHEFEHILLNARLLPSQKLILENLKENMQKLKNRGFNDLLALQRCLKDKKNYSKLSEDLNIDGAYLILLNRMINSYVVKVYPLEKLDFFTKAELQSLQNGNLVNSKQFYEKMAGIPNKDDFSKAFSIPPGRLEYALRLIDLLRINGVGVEYAKILYNIGIKCVADYNNTPSEDLLKAYKSFNQDQAHPKATLGISDIDYCRRFCEKLDCDINE